MRRGTLALAAIAVLLAVLCGIGEGERAAWAQSQAGESGESGDAMLGGGRVPGGTLGSANDAEMWRAVRRGVSGTVSIPDKKAGVLVQSEGDSFRAFRNGPLSTYGGWAMLGMIVFLALFFLLRGRIRISSGFSGRMVLRFTTLERFAHWLTAGSFIVLALTGLNMLYGKFVLMPVIGQSAFATLTGWGKLGHNFIGFAFTAGVLLMVVLWLRDNLPHWRDMQWLIVAGGLLSKDLHPPAKKFNAGQKIIFWIVVLLGLSMAVTGICLMFPFEFSPFAILFQALNVFGLGLPTELTGLQEAQLALVWHGIVAVLLTMTILGHIYIGTLGMEGAVGAVTTGEVDENWAREHHSIWLEEMKEREKPVAAE
jgi:formate dehydrogenase subunit gamma